MHCPRCRHDNPAGMKFCGQCAAPLVAVCPGCGAANPPDNRFCGQCAASLSPGPTAKFAGPDSYTPNHLAEKILTSKSALEGERKQVTVLFADLKGSMELLADRDPEEARKLLDPVLEHMMEAVHRYEGTVNQVMGDGIMALFGAPLAHEDHAVRACYAALRMQESVGRYAEEVFRSEGVLVQIRVGLNAGEVVVRTIGSDLHMDYTAVGQTTHLAARMEQMAAPGSILMTAEVLRLAEGYVQVKPLGAVPVKGLGSAVEVFQVVGAGPVRRRLEAAAARGLTRFVGRSAELDQLRQALERAGAGHGQVVALVGEAGVGKSRLIREFAHSHRAQGWLVLESSSVSYGRATPYLPVVELLRGYLQIEDADTAQRIREKVTGKVLTLDERLRDAIAPALSLLEALPQNDPFHALDPPQRRETIQGALKRLLLAESQRQPLCLVFEDLHWIDAETQRFLDSLVDSLPTARILLLVNYRPEYQHGWGGKTSYRQLRLDPLTAESAEELLRGLLGSDEGLEPLKRLLVERTEGNPFFLEESVRALVETGGLAGDRGNYRAARALPGIQVPATVQAILAARIDRLAPETKRFLQAASVIGKDVPYPPLRAIVEEPEDALRRGLGHLQAAEFLYEKHLFPEIEYTFKHALTHEVVYGGILQERRRALDARLVDAIERLAGDRWPEQADVLAHHALRGEVWDRAVDYLREAGARALARGAVAECLERYEQALGLLPGLPESPENLRRRIDVTLGLYEPLFLTGQLPRLRQLLDEAEEVARRLDVRPRLGRVLAWRAVSGLMDARYADGAESCREALDIAHATGSPDLRVSARHLLGMSHFGRGDLRAAVEALAPLVDGEDAGPAREVRTFVFGSPYIQGCCWLALCRAILGEFPAAAAYADRAVREAEASGVPQAQAFAYGYRAMTLVISGEAAEALPWSERALHLCETKGLVYWLSFTSSMRGWALAWSGRTAEALPLLEQGATLQEALGTRFLLPYFHVVWAEGLLSAGEISRAGAAAGRAMEIAAASGERIYETWALLVLGAVAAASDPPDPAAVDLFERARALAEELGMKTHAARCLLGLGRVHRRAGEPGRARERLETAAAMFREMGLRGWLAQTEAELKELPSAGDECGSPPP